MATELNAATAAQRKAMTEPFYIAAEGLLWMAVHGTLCLGLRHPAYTGPSRELVLRFTKRLGRDLVAWGCLTEEELAVVNKTEQQESPHHGG
jgi:hypothetical protein